MSYKDNDFQLFSCINFAVSPKLLFNNAFISRLLQFSV
jgi:hypothetical protein